MPKESLLDKLRVLGVIINGPHILRSGANTNIDCDIKKAYGYPDVFSEIVDEVSKKLHWRTTCVAGLGHGGIPLATAVALHCKLKSCMVRIEPKSYALADPIGGYIPGPGDVVAIVDDVFTSGGSIRDTLNVLATTGAQFTDAVVIVNRGDKRLSPVPLRYIFKLAELT